MDISCLRKEDDDDLIMYEIRLAAFARLHEWYGPPIGIGRNRAVFNVNNEYVIKLPINGFGDLDNHYELNPDAWIAHEHLAKTWSNDELNQAFNLDLVCMEWVDTTYVNDAPDWCKGVDCNQVGYTKDGRLVAYDFGR